VECERNDAPRPPRPAVRGAQTVKGASYTLREKIALRDGEPDKPDLATYVVMCLVLFLLVLLIVFFINCQLRNSFFASMPYDRSLREARSSYK
uniref:Small integral membrane protein 32 n=1 Tax=Cyprinus carpio TaxID=7962 RepID=A0A8C1Z0R3_CYPCA